MTNKQQIPAIHELISRALAQGILSSYTPRMRTQLARAYVGSLRREAATPDDHVAELKQYIANFEAGLLQPVINATGVVLHTNLGRAPLAPTYYTNLEYDLTTGERGKRGGSLDELARLLMESEKCTVVNNGAAAIYLALAALVSGKEVIISRGELVQIGGGFRIPDILTMSGARLVEVGTTNITSLSDYEKAVNDNTGLILLVHRSNFFLQGHCHSPSVKDIARLAKSKQVPLVFDLGSGMLTAQDFSHSAELTVTEALRQGVDLVTFSGDKLLGGPQAGFIAGRSELVQKCRQHPLYRVVRPGHLTLWSLQEVLLHYARGEEQQLPALACLAAAEEDLALKAQRISHTLTRHGVSCQMVDLLSAPGGGAQPETHLESFGVAVYPADPSQFARALRQQKTPIVCRIEKKTLFFDMRTVLKGQEEALVCGIVGAWEETMGISSLPLPASDRTEPSKDV